MEHRTNAARLASLALLVVGASGCGALQRMGEAPPVDPDAITVEVRNNLSPPTTLTVYAVDEGGTRNRLGTVTGSTTQRFVVDLPPVGRVLFYARTSEGGEVISQPVSLRPQQRLEWDVFANIVTQRFGGVTPDAAPVALTRTGASAPDR